MTNVNTPGFPRENTSHASGKDKLQQQSCFITLIAIAFMLSGCSSGLEGLDEEVGKYVKEYKEEFALLRDIPTYFGYPNGEYPTPDGTQEPLHSFLVKMTKKKQPVFAPTTIVIHFHYPADLKEISCEQRVSIGVSEIGYAPQVHKPGALRSMLSVIERDNKNQTGVLYAQCRFLLQIYGYPPGTDLEIGNFVWLFCHCTWDAEKQVWRVSNIRRLSDGEAIPEHY